MALQIASYLTNGTSLFYLLGFNDEGVIFEDCLSEEILEVSYEELAAMDLRVLERELAHA